MAIQEKMLLSCMSLQSVGSCQLIASFMMAKARRAAGKQRVIFWFNVSILAGGLV